MASEATNDATQKLVDDLRAYGKGDDTSIVPAELLRIAADTLEATRRPPVSPEQREAIIECIDRRIGWRSLHWEINGPELPPALADALLARFSFPTLDPEKVARWLAERHDPCVTEGGCEFGYGYYRTDADALIAALPTLGVES